jgi:hypothetical protein
LIQILTFGAETFPFLGAAKAETEARQRAAVMNFMVELADYI